MKKRVGLFNRPQSGPPSNLNGAALRDYIEAEARQIQDIEQGIAEANRGEFASDSEVNAFFAKYGG